MSASKAPKQLNSRLTLVVTRYLSRAHAAVYRITRGRVGGNLRVGAGFRKPAPTLLLEHTGRKSGNRFTTPLLYVTDGADVVVVASAGGRDEHPQWYRNLLAGPDTHVTIGGDRRAVSAVQASADERARLWPRLVEAYADFDSYQTWTDRELPVMVLKPPLDASPHGQRDARLRQSSSTRALAAMGSRASWSSWGATCSWPARRT